jgi:hypothetical protein
MRLLIAAAAVAALIAAALLAYHLGWDHGAHAAVQCVTDVAGCGRGN